MRVLLLGPKRTSLEKFLIGAGDEVTRIETPLPRAPNKAANYDFVVSYGYRHIIGNDWLHGMLGRAVNLHISYLPWNRGSDPNLWSILDDTPKGVSIHLLDSGLDTGPLLAQREVLLESGDTLASSYARLSRVVEEVFREVWTAIREGKITPVPQPPGGSYHRQNERQRVEHLLTRGWDTPVEELLINYRRLLSKANA